MTPLAIALIVLVAMFLLGLPIFMSVSYTHLTLPTKA